MKKQRIAQFDIQRLTYSFVIIALVVFFMYIARALLIPLAFGVLFTLMFLPLIHFFERWVKHRVPAILLTFITVLVPLLGLLTALGFQFYRLIEGIPAIGARLQQGLLSVLDWIQARWSLEAIDVQQWIQGNVATLINTPLNVLTTSLSLSTTFIAGMALSLLYSFFFLLYKASFRNFFLYQFGPHTRGEARVLLYELQRVTREYLYGLVLVICILGILNGAGLWLIGINYAFFWGFLAALLAIIPYVGTTLGGTLPFLYALATTTTFWQPAAVVALYFAIQQIEGNFITPKVVGSSVKVNPLIAIIALIAGGLLWGISGLILAIPTVAAVRVVFNHFRYLQPAGALMSDDLYHNSRVFAEKFDGPGYRLFTLFSKTKKESGKAEAGEPLERPKTEEKGPGA